MLILSYTCSCTHTYTPPWQRMEVQYRCLQTLYPISIRGPNRCSRGRLGEPLALPRRDSVGPAAPRPTRPWPMLLTIFSPAVASRSPAEKAQKHTVGFAFSAINITTSDARHVWRMMSHSGIEMGKMDTIRMVPNSCCQEYLVFGRDSARYL